LKFKAKSTSTLLELVKSEKGYSSNTRTRTVIKSGGVKVEGKIVKIPSTEISQGTSIEITSGKMKAVKNDVPYFPHEIIFEDDLLLVVNKRTGVITKSKNGKLRTLFSSASAYLKGKGEERPFLVNSVDKKESGLVLMAKDLRTLKALEIGWKSFLKRHYIVIPGGMLDEKGKLEDTFHENDIGLLLPGPGKKTHEVELNYRVMRAIKNTDQNIILKKEWRLTYFL